MTDLIKRAANNVLSTQELNALQSLAMMPLQQVFMKVNLTLPFERLAVLLRGVKHNLSAEQPVIHFVSPHHGDGADIIAFEMAYVASTQSGKRVLFINTSPNSKLARRGKHIEENVTYAPFSSNGKENTFFFTTVSAAGNDEKVLPDVQDFKKIIGDLRKMFDLVIIHSDLALTSHMANTLYGLTDGCVIVAEAERTRRPVIHRLRNVIEQQGGRIVGVVLNRRKFYIPSRLYSFLFRAAD